MIGRAIKVDEDGGAPRICWGSISALSSDGTGPRPMAKPAMSTMMETSGSHVMDWAVAASWTSK